MTVQQQPPSSQQSSAPAPQPPPTLANKIDVNSLGVFVDGWSELIEGMGTKADQVRSDVLDHLKARNMPNIGLGNKIGYVSLISKERRDYMVAETDPGARTTIFIAQHGVDLYASWRTWIEPKVNMDVLQWLIGGAVVLGLLTGGLNQTGGLYGPSRISFSLIGWVIYTIGFLLLAGGIIALAGKILKGSFLAYFFIEPNVFDAEDITAMSLSVHKSIIRSLDKSGIDVSKLRLKQSFKGGRKDVEV